MKVSPNRGCLFALVPPSYQIVICCALGFTLFGYDQGLYGGIIINQNFLNDFDHPSSTILGQIQATFDLGAFVGAVGICMWGDRLGRRMSIIIGCVTTIVGGVIQAASYSAAQLIVGRLIAGIGTGFITSTVPVWQSETCGAMVRGAMILAELGVVAVGASIAAWVNVGCRFVDSEFAWRFPMALQCLYAIGCLCMVLYLPESPRWLIFKGRVEEGERALAMILEKDESDAEVQALKNEIEISVEHEREISKNTTWRSMLKSDETQNLRRIALGVATQVFQKLGGIDVINYYMGYIVMNYAGMSQTQSLCLTAGNLMNQAFFTFCSILLIERVGRRYLLAGGHLVEGISYTVVTIGLGLGTKTSRVAAVSFMFVFISAFGLTNNAIPWLYPAEINSQQSRFLGAALATGADWIFNYLIAMITPIAIDNIDWRYYIVFSVLNFVFAIVTYLIIVETAGMSLEQIDEWFARDFHERRGEEYIPPAEKAFAEKKLEEVEHVETIDEAYV
uniref:ARAD1D18634p n=1 Tax=Blastobotrys adeninivorans TaxID=409370 RepID=A0A060T9Y4_BLAAD